MIPEQMQALRLHSPGRPSALRHERIPTPQPGPGEVLVRVHAAAITRDELDWPEGRLPATPSYEFSGVVALPGRGVEGLVPGKEVYALSGFDRDGAAADYIVVLGEVLASKPETLDHVESAAVPLAGLSAWQGLFDHGGLSRGDRVLIHGATGGVGGFAVQLARVRGAHVIATASAENVRAARDLGADEVIDHSSSSFEELVEPVDLVFDTAGGERLERSPAVLRRGGRLVSITAQPTNGIYFVVEPNRDQLAELGALADAGELRVPIDKTFRLAEGREAFERSLGQSRRGKIVLRVALNETS